MMNDLKTFRKNQLERLISVIDEKELIGILKKLIATPSHINYLGQEIEISNTVAKILKKENIHTILQKVKSDRFNVIAEITGRGSCKSLVFNGHLDTVPPNNKMKSYEASIRDEKVFGLGAADMKGAVAAMIYSMVLIKRLDIKLCGSAYFTGVIGEESGGTGTRFLMNNGFKADYFIVGEPTSLKIVNSHKGCFLMDIVIKGKAAHGSIPEKGANAISAMGDFISLINNKYIPMLKTCSQEGVGSPTINFGIIQGGKKTNIVADKCLLGIDRRWIESEKDINFISEIEPYLKKACYSNSKLRYEIIPTLPADSYFGPFYIQEDHELIEITINALKNINYKFEVAGMQGWTDGATILNKGFPVLIIGPGSMGKAHSEDEFVPIKELVNAVKIYLSLICEVCTN